MIRIRPKSPEQNEQFKKKKKKKTLKNSDKNID